MDDSDFIADLFHVGENMGVEKHAPVLLLHAEHHLFHLPAADRIEAVERFVQKEILRVVHERLRETEPLAHAF